MINIKLVIALITLAASVFYFLSESNDVQIELKSNEIDSDLNLNIDLNINVYKKFEENGHYYIIDYDKNLRKVGKSSYDKS